MTHERWQREIMARGELYRVGGTVRDRLMGLGVSPAEGDYLVRGISPEALEKLLSPLGRVALVGKAFAVYKFKPTGEERAIDIAFPRKEVSTGPGHRDFRIAFDWTLPVEADLGRRDFTINAMAESVSDGRFIDPFGGRKDIENRVLRMIFPAAFEEDPLRILRGVRFAARFGLEIEPATLAAMKRSASGVSVLSAERIQEEMTKLLTECERPSEGFVRLHDLGVLALFLPELDRGFGVAQNEYHPDDVFYHSIKTCDEAPRDNLAVRWAALLHDLGKVDSKKTVEEAGRPPRVVFYGHEMESARIAENVLRRLRFGNELIERCTALVRHHMFDYRPEWTRATVRRFIRRVGAEYLEDLLRLREADCMSRQLDERVAEVGELKRRAAEEIASKSALTLRDLAVDGRDVMKVLGLKEGPRVGEILNELFDRVLETPSLNTRERLFALLDDKKG